MATIYKTDGTIQTVIPIVGPHFSLKEMQAIVGGYIEIINLSDGYMVINEEGKIYKLPINENATALVHGYGAIFSNDYIVGDALVCSTEEMN